jgi:hypothetical protein
LFSSGAAHGDDPEVKPLWEALYAANADVVIGGHHHYERFAPQDPSGNPDPQRRIREFIVGTGGKNSHRKWASPERNSEVRQADTFGVLKLTPYELRLGICSAGWQNLHRLGKRDVPLSRTAPGPRTLANWSGKELTQGNLKPNRGNFIWKLYPDYRV